MPTEQTGLHGPDEPSLGHGDSRRRRRGWKAAALAAAAAVVATGVYTALTGERPFGRATNGRLESATFTDRSAALGNSLAFSPNGMLLAVAGTFHKTVIYNLATAKQIASLPARGKSAMTSDVFSPDGRTLAVTSRGPQTTQMWNVSTGQLEPALPEPRNFAYYSATYSPDGTLLAAASNDDGTYVWNVAHRRLLATLNYPNTASGPIVFSPVGRTLAVADGFGSGNIHLWNVTRHRTIATLHDPGGHGICSIDYSPDGTLLAATDAAHIFLWNVGTRSLAATITPPSHVFIRALEFSPAGPSIAATSVGNSTYIWSTATHKLIATLADPAGRNTANLAYSPDGRTLAVSDDIGNIYLWDVTGL